MFGQAGYQSGNSGRRSGDIKRKHEASELKVAEQPESHDGPEKRKELITNIICKAVALLLVGNA